MRKFLAYAAFLSLAGCNTYLPEARQLGSAPEQARYATITPGTARLSNPTVATDRGVMAYDEDLEGCKAKASARMGGEAGDDLAAIKRALQQGPLGGTVSVGYEATDAAVSRDKLVKNCLSKRGYLVAR